MSNSTGSSPTTSRSVPHSSQDTISPLSVSKSTWTSASHSGQVPVGTVSSSPLYVRQGTSAVRESTSTCKQPNQSTRDCWNLQQSFSGKVGPGSVTFLCRKYPCHCRRENKVWKRIVERRYSVKVALATRLIVNASRPGRYCNECNHALDSRCF